MKIAVMQLLTSYVRSVTSYYKPTTAVYVAYKCHVHVNSF